MFWGTRLEAVSLPLCVVGLQRLNNQFGESQALGRPARMINSHHQFALAQLAVSLILFVNIRETRAWRASELAMGTLIDH